MTSLLCVKVATPDFCSRDSKLWHMEPHSYAGKSKRESLKMACEEHKYKGENEL